MMVRRPQRSTDLDELNESGVVGEEAKGMDSVA
jgi:hypothetical protein